MHRYLESTEFYHRRYQNFSTLIIIPAFILFIGIIIFISIGKIDTTTNTTGELVNHNQVVSLANSNNINSINLHQRTHFIIKNSQGNNKIIPGKVISVASKPSTNIKGINYYKIQSSLKPNKTDNHNLRLGLNGTTIIIQNRKTILKNIINKITNH